MRFAGEIGFSESVDRGDDTGVTINKIYRRPYYGDVLKNYRSWKENQFSTIGDITINNQISLVGDPFLFEHLQFMKFVIWMGRPWSVTSVDVEYPRLIISIGGVYNGPTE